MHCFLAFPPKNQNEWLFQTSRLKVITQKIAFSSTTQLMNVINFSGQKTDGDYKILLNLYVSYLYSTMHQLHIIIFDNLVLIKF